MFSYELHILLISYNSNKTCFIRNNVQSRLLYWDAKPYGYQYKKGTHPCIFCTPAEDSESEREV